jgi:hypothetical protein
MGPLALAALAGTAAWGGWKLLQKANTRFVGDVAKVGDEVLVHPQFVPNSAQLKLAPGTLWVAIKVAGVDKERLQGPVVGWQQPGTSTTFRIPAAVGSFVVTRQSVFRVIRDGKTIATNG